MSSDITKIISAMEFAAQHGLRHFLLDDGQTRIELWCDGQDQTPATQPSPPVTATTASGPGHVATSGAVCAPLPGMCHLSPDPASPPFVTEGARIEVGQTLCIIEAMKMMTAVHAERPGRVTKVLVGNGTVVSAGDRLMEIGA